MTHPGGTPAAPPLNGDAPRVGRFLFHVEQRRWEWSSEVFAIHGYEPGTVTPTTDLILEHVLPEHRIRVQEVIRGPLDSGACFACPHTIVDTNGRHRLVVATGVSYRGDDVTERRSGFLVDLSATHDQQVREAIDDQVATITASRSSIDQARGVLMATYRIDADAAWELLRARSQGRNVKVRDIAAQLLHAIHTGAGSVTDLVSDIVPARIETGRET